MPPFSLCKKKKKKHRVRFFPSESREREKNKRTRVEVFFFHSRAHSSCSILALREKSEEKSDAPKSHPLRSLLRSYFLRREGKHSGTSSLRRKRAPRSRRESKRERNEEEAGSVFSRPHARSFAGFASFQKFIPSSFFSRFRPRLQAASWRSWFLTV